MKKINKIFFSVTIIILLFSGFSFSQEAWIVSEDANSRVNPIEMNSANIDLGSEIFKKNCQSCHGEPGMNNFLPLVPPPVDITSEQMQKNTEGGIFYKITIGRGGMPTFEKTLSDDERWKLTTYIKSFSSDLLLNENQIKLNDVVIVLNLDTADFSITATVTGKNEKQEVVPVVDEKINFYIKRYFGNLALNQTVLKTNSLGIAKVKYTSNIPGDSLGNLQLIVELDSKLYKNTSVSQQISWGVPTVPENILDQQAMWGNRSMAPWWIVLLYLSVTGGVWISILYVVSLVLKIKKMGKKV